MKGDFTRNTFDAAHHFSRVLMQQGRVQLDSDWNELQDILLYYLRTLARDIFGPYGGPNNDELGFVVSIDSGKTDLKVSAGHYYVHGILCENEGQMDATGALSTSYFNQPYYPMTDEEKKDGHWKSGRWLAYLDVWERHVSYLKEDSIRESALGGPDTATRSQVVWQVRLAPYTTAPASPTCSDLLPPDRPDKQARLRARVRPDETSTDPCITPPSYPYRGGNQLYRIEIHRGNDGGQPATFKWSRDNGAIAARWLRNEDNALIVGNTRGFQKDKWIELTDEVRELRGQPGEMRQIVSIDGDAVVVDQLPPVGNYPRNPIVRQWDQSGTEEQDLQDGVLPVVPMTSQAEHWLEIEQGLEIQFDLAAGATLHTGDYWIIPARAATGRLEWPEEKIDQTYYPRALPPRGVHHYYAPLTLFNDGVIDNNGDCLCRVTFDSSCAPNAQDARR